MALPKVSVLVVSYNTAAATVACITALRHSVGVDLEVIVVDNASTDGSAEAIREACPETDLICSSVNLGYGRAMNLAFDSSRGRYILVLNSDCYVGNMTIADCVAFLDREPSASAVACQLRYPDGAIQNTCRAFPSVGAEAVRIFMPHQLLRKVPRLGSYYMGGWGHDSVRMVDQPAGAFLLARRHAWGGGHPFDPRFFMYYEDVDFCRRLWLTGPIWFLATTHAVHIGELSSSASRVRMATALAQSRYLYFEKWHGRSRARVAVLAAAMASTTRAAGWSVGALASDSTARSRAAGHWAAARRSYALALRPSGYARAWP